MNINRRTFIKRGATALAGIGAMGSLAAQSLFNKPDAQPKNILLIICDDLNDTIAGMGGHPQARTPNIERLIARGMRFTNAHCNAPICGPSRASLWTGIYPHTSGLYGYDQQKNHWRDNPTLKDAVTVFEHFMNNGHEVYGTGKVFHNGHEDNSVWLGPDGFNGLGLPASFGPFPWDGVSHHPNGKRKGAAHPSMPGYYHDKYWECFAPLSDVPTVGNYTGWSGDHEDFHYVDENDRDLMPDEESAQWVCQRLGEDHKKPFFITLGLNRPHVPRYVPRVYYDLFPLEEIELPPYMKNDLDDCAQILWKDPVTGRPTYFSEELGRLIDAGGEELWKRWIQSYLAAVAFTDAQVGAVLDALDAGPYKDDTTVILTSDHGYHMGEKEHLQKTTIWGEVTRVPLVIHVPGMTPANSECPLPVSLIDLYPTLIDLARLPREPNAGGNDVELDGHSLVPLLQDPGGTWSGPTVALSCLHGWDELQPNEPGQATRQQFSIRSMRWRYTYCYNREEELYNHLDDPHEWHNLADDPAHAWTKYQLKLMLKDLVGLP